MKKYSYCVCLHGLNFDRLFKSFENNNITIYNISRADYKTCEFCLGFADYLKAKKLKLFKNFKVSIKKAYNLGFFIDNLLKNVGLYVGILISIIFCLIVSNITLKIDVLGVEQLLKNEIVEQLENINVKTGKINTISNEEIEQYLKQNNSKISLVSVAKKGTNLIVNIKEKVTIDSVVSPICASYNMVVDNIVVSQGVAKVKSGDIVKKGQVLVEPQIVFTNGVKTELQPIAKINAKAWIVGCVEFKEEEILFKRTGKKVVWSNYELSGNKIFSSTPQVKFENYEKIEYNNYVFNNLFLPIKLNRTTFYETKKDTITKNFDEVKNDLINQSREIAFNKLPGGVNVESENTIVSKVGKTYYVTTYLQINLQIEG